jgi:hypothetical protein
MGVTSLFLSKVKDIGTAVKDSFTGAGDAVTGIIDSAKGQIPPEYQGKIELMKLEVMSEVKKLEMNTEVKLTELSATAQKQVYDFAIQYEGTAAQVPKWILVMRSIIRPVVTICMFFSLMFFIGFDVRQAWEGNYDNLIMTVLPQAYWVILGIILGFWFGGKAAENVTDKIKAK